MKCKDCNWYWKDEDMDFATCHCDGEGPCEEDEPENKSHRMTWSELDDYFVEKGLIDATLGRLMDEAAEDGEFPDWNDEVPEWVYRVMGL